MDDPIFGPWSDQEDEAPTPPFRAPRWRPRADPRDVPAHPAPFAPRRDASKERAPDIAEAYVGPARVEPARAKLTIAAPALAKPVQARPAVAEPVAVERPIAERETLVDVLGQPIAVEPSPVETVDHEEDSVEREAAPASPALVKLRTLLVPACKALSQRLMVHRHLTTLDDRLDWNPPSVRFRVEPWRAPFDSPEAQPSSAIEFELEDGKRLAARVWMDVFSTVPDHRDSVSIESLTSTWIEKTLMSYVARVLAGD